MHRPVPPISRRKAIALLGGAAAAPSALAAAERFAGSLDADARAKGLRFGSAIGWRTVAPGVAPERDLVARECGLVVAENEMKWAALRPAADRFDFRRFDAMLGWAEARGLAMRGHTLLWHQRRWMPRWIEAHAFGRAGAGGGERLLVDHIRTVCGRYGARIGSYDVVNEAVDPATGALHETALSRAIGGADRTLDLAFRTARAAAPHAELVYNDFMSWEPGHERHRAGVLRLLEGFRQRGVPVDALGIQSHLVVQGVDGGVAPADERAWRGFLDAVVAMGYRLVVTELDVRDKRLPADEAVRDRAVARYARAYLDVMLGYPQLRDVLVWGLSDRYSWIGGFDPRADGLAPRPCPYDRRFRPKPLRAAIAAALAAAQPRRGTARRGPERER